LIERAPRRLARPALGAFALAVALAGVGACTDAKRGEAGLVLRAIEVARAAPNDAKRAPTEALAKVACSAPDVCRARDLCADAFRHLVAGVEGESRVREQMRELAPDAAATPERAKALEAELDRAEAELEAARAALRPCEQAATEMRRTHRI
jgi:hypothetical protein